MHSTCYTRLLHIVLVCAVLSLCVIVAAEAADTVPFKKMRSMLDTRHREYVQSLETYGPDAIETRLAFDRYTLAYKQYQEAMNALKLPSASPPLTVTASPQAGDEHQDTLDEPPGVKSDIKIGSKMLVSGNISGAAAMYKMAFSRAVVSPVRVFFMRMDMFFDRLFGPKPPEEFDITDITPPPDKPPVVPPPDERRVKPPAKEDTSWIGDFKYERIMSDSSFTNVNAMTEREVQNFLEKRGSVLAKPYRGRRPSALIMDACRKHDVSPKVLLARLQTEQGLISRKTATQHQLDWALGVGCYDSGDWNEKFKGLGKQIEYAAVTLKKHYISGQETIGQKGVIAMTIDGTPMRIQNAATYSMYKYCPHKHGNKLFYDVYMGFFALLLFLLMKVICL